MRPGAATLATELGVNPSDRFESATIHVAESVTSMVASPYDHIFTVQ
jgi:hypothetical protein